MGEYFSKSKHYTVYEREDEIDCRRAKEGEECGWFVECYYGG